MNVPEIDAASLLQELDGQNPPRLLDVREAEELAQGHLPGVVHVPLMELPERMGELDSQADWVVICRVGGRSARATAFLRGQGFARVRNLVGGMEGLGS